MSIDSRLRSSAEQVREEAKQRAVGLEPPATKHQVPWGLATVGMVVVILVLVVAALQPSPTGDVAVPEVPPTIGQPPEGFMRGSSADQGFDYLLPIEGWLLIEETLLPDLADLPFSERYKGTLVAFATFLAEPGSDIFWCDFKPQNALEQLGPADALISVIEMSETRVPEFPDRRRATGIYEGVPEQLYPYIGELNNDSCYDLANEGRAEPLFYREYIYNDQGRAFIVQVGIGGQATDETKRQVWQIVDSLEYKPLTGS